jgi:hypothetical protein
MARQSKISSEQALKAELEANERKEIRATGFEKMHERDKGYEYLSNGTVFAWHVDPKIQERYLKAGELKKNIPKDSFVLVIDGKEILFNTDEFRQSLRWA